MVGSGGGEHPEATAHGPVRQRNSRQRRYRQGTAHAGDDRNWNARRFGSKQLFSSPSEDKCIAPLQPNGMSVDTRTRYQQLVDLFLFHGVRTTPLSHVLNRNTFRYQRQ